MIQDECSFVSLRDLERSLLVTAWFYDKMDVIQEKNLVKLYLILITLNFFK